MIAAAGSGTPSPLCARASRRNTNAATRFTRSPAPPPPPCACCCHRLRYESRFERICGVSPGFGSNLTEIPVVAPKAHFRPVPTLATGGSNENVPLRSVGGSQACFACAAPPPSSPTPRAGPWQSPKVASHTDPMWGIKFWSQDRTLRIVRSGAKLRTRPGFAERDGAVSASVQPASQDRWFCCKTGSSSGAHLRRNAFFNFDLARMLQ